MVDSISKTEVKSIAMIIIKLLQKHFPNSNEPHVSQLAVCFPNKNLGVFVIC